MAATNDNSLVRMSRATTTRGVPSSSARQRHRLYFRPCGELLEPRLALSGMPELVVSDRTLIQETWDVPTEVFEERCTVVSQGEEQRGFSIGQESDSKTESIEFEPDLAGDDNSCDDDTEMPIPDGDESHVNGKLSDTANEFNLTSGASSEPNTDVVISQPESDTVTNDQPKPTSPARLVDSSIPTTPVIAGSTPGYFSGTRSLGRAHWKAELGDVDSADVFIERIELEKSNLIVAADTATDNTSEIAQADEHSAVFAAAYLEEFDWTQPPSNSSPTWQSGAPAPLFIPAVVSPFETDSSIAFQSTSMESPMTSDPAVADATSSFGWVQKASWIGGFGLWPIILSARGPRRKRRRSNPE